jgi:hypothetical protein
MHSATYRDPGASAPAEPAAAPARGAAWHYKPSRHFHTEEAVRHVDSLAEALLVWVASERPAKVLDVAGEVDLEELRAQLASALAAAVEWDGRSVVAQLVAKFSWPDEQTLVERIHRWSCALHRAKYENWIAQRDARRERRRAKRATS